MPIDPVFVSENMAVSNSNRFVVYDVQPPYKDSVVHTHNNKGNKQKIQLQHCWLDQCHRPYRLHGGQLLTYSFHVFFFLFSHFNLPKQQRQSAFEIGWFGTLDQATVKSHRQRHRFSVYFLSYFVIDYYVRYVLKFFLFFLSFVPYGCRIPKHNKMEE